MTDDAPDAQTSDRRVELLVLLGAALIVSYHAWQQYRPYSFLHGDGSFYAIINRALAEGTLEQERFHPMSWYRERLRWNDDLDPGWSDLALGADGRTLWPKHPILLPLLHAPLFHAFGLNGLLLGSVVMSSLSIWLAHRIATRVASVPAAACAALAFASTPLLLHNAYSYSNDTLYTVLALGAIDATQRSRGLLAGLLWGGAMVAKPTVALLAAPFAAHLVALRRWKVLARMALGAAGPLGALAVMNTVMFGGALVSGYNRILVRHGGVPATFDIREKFGRAIGVGLRAIVSDPQQGVALSAPASLLSLPGLVPLARSPRGRAFAAAFAVSLGATALFYARFEFTYARFFTPWVVLAVAPVAALLDVLVAWAARLRGRERLPSWLRALLGDPRWFPLVAGVATVFGAARSAPQFGPAVAASAVAASLFRDELWALLGAALSRVAAWLTRARLAAILGVAAALLAALPGVVARATRRPARWVATEALRDASVRILPTGGAPVPCDYFNPSRQKWECADWERGDSTWGRALGAECAFANAPGDWLSLNPNADLTREIAWRALPPGDLRVRYGVAPTSQHTDVTVVLQSGPARHWLRTPRVGELQTLVIPAAARGADLRIIAPTQPHDARHLCVEVTVP